MKTKNFLSQSGGKPDVTRRQNRNRLGSVISRLSLGSIVSRFSLVSLICVLMLTLGVGNAWADESWDLTTASYSSASTATVTWSGTTATMTLEKNGGTNANNYLGGSGSYTHTRVYNNNILRITPASGQTISSIAITATSSSYLIAGTWTNGTATTSGSVTTVTPTDGTSAVYITCNATKRLTAVSVTMAGGCSGTKLGTPVVTATPSSGQIVLSWSNVSNASSYQLKWNGGDWASATSPVTKSGLSNGTSYTYQVKAIGNGTTYCDGDASDEASATPNVYYTVTWMNNGSQHTTTSVVSGQKPTFPTTPTSCDTGDGASSTFYGWATSTWSGKIDDISGKTIYTSAASMPAVSGAVTYHAVFCKGSGGSVTLTGSDFHDNLTASYADQTITKTIGATDYTFNLNACEPNNTGNKCQMRDNATVSYIQIPSLPGVITRITATSISNASDGAYTGTLHFKSAKTRGNSNTNDIARVTYSSGITSLDWDLSSDNTTATTGYFVTSAGLRMTDFTVYYGSAGSKYMTNCCTALGTITGTVTVTYSGTSATVKSWTYTQGGAAAESNISTYDVYLYSDADSYAAPISTQTCAYNAKATGVTFTGLSYARTYKVKIGATGKTNYCDITPVQVTTINSTSTQTFQLPCVSAGLAYGTASVTKTYGDAAFTNTLTNSHNVTVSYAASSVSPAGCISVNSSTGAVTINGAGSATITATAAEQIVSNVRYCEGSASYTLTVNKADISPTLSYTSTNLTTGYSSSSPTITGNTGSGAVTYSVTASDPSGCVTVDPSTGVVTANAAGTATVTATIAATNNYNSGTATANFTITNAVCSDYSFHTGGTDVKTNNTPTCFTQVGSSTTWKIENYTIPNNSTDSRFFVGHHGYFYDDNLGSANSRSAVKTWAEEMFFEYTKNYGDGYRPTVGWAKGAVGTLYIWSDNNWNNLHVGFSPRGYVFKLGSTNLAMTGSTTLDAVRYWETEVRTLTATNISGNYQVNLYKEGAAGGVASNNTQSTALNTMGVKSNSGNNWRATPLGDADADTRGFFRIDIGDGGVTNWHAHFVPTHRVIFHSNYPNGGGPADTYSVDVSVEETNNSIALASAPTAPKGYTWDGWYDAASGGTKVTTARSIAAGATADIELYAHWTANTISLTLNKNNSDAGSTAGSGSINYDATSATISTAPTRTGYTVEGYYTNAACSDANKVLDASGNVINSTVTGYITSGKWTRTTTPTTLYTKWNIVNYNVTWYAGGTADGNITTAGNPTTSVAYNNKVTDLPSNPSGTACDKTFVGWTNTTSYTHGTSLLFTDAAGSPTITGDTRFYAVFAAGGDVTWTRVTSVATITGGGTFIIGYEADHSSGKGTIVPMRNNDKTATTSTQGLIRSGTTAGSSTGGTITMSSLGNNGGDDYEVTIASGTASGRISIQLADGNYIGLPNSGNNVKLYAANNTTSTDLIPSIGDDDVVTLSMIKDSAFQYNATSGSERFSRYKKTQKNVVLYKKGGGAYDHTIYCADCGTSVTVNYSAPGSGNTMTVTRNAAAVSSGSTVKTCSATSLIVTLTPTTHYLVTNFTATGVTGVTTSHEDNVYTVNIPAAASGTLVLTPTFTPETPLTITFDVSSVSGVTAGSIGTIYSGDDFDFPTVSGVPSGFCADFLGWVDATDGTTFDGDGTTTTEPAELIHVGDNSGAVTTNKTYKAVYGESESEEVEAYAKVTSALSDYSGKYLIVCETAGVAFDGSLTTLDATSNNFAVTISSSTVSTLYTTKEWTIAKSGDNYTIKSASGYYIGRTANSNGLNSSTSDAYTNTISVSSGTATITSSSGPVLKFNNNNDQKRFRYFGSGQTDVQLYKFGTTTVTTYTYTTAPSCGDKYRVTVADVTGGSPSASPKYCADGTTISLVANPANGYSFTRWTITKDGTNPLQDVTSTLLTGSKPTTASTSFTMPAYDVTVTATYGLTNYSITYNNLNGATNTNPATYNVTSADIVFVDPGERSGFAFKGWYDDAVYTNLVTGIPNGSTGAVTVYAKWVVGYTITWSNGVGDNPASTGVESGNPIGTLPTPTGSCEVDGTTYSNFVGWYTGTISGVGTAASDAGTEITGATVPTASATYHAVYTNMADYSDTHTSNVTLPANPTSPVATAKIKVSSEDDAPEYDGIKIGTSKNKTGSFTFTVPSGTTKITLHGVAWSGKTASVTLATSVGTISPSTAQSLDDNSGASDNSPFTITSNTTLTFNLANVSSEATITLSNSSERVIVWGINASSASGEDVGYITQCCDNMLAAPVVTGTANSSTQITLSWPAVTGATGYKVSWNGGDWEDLGTTRSYVKTGLEPGETYSWKVIGKYNAAQKCGAETASGTTTTKSVYHVTYVGGSGTGTCTATHVPTDNTAYEAGQTVTLPATSGEGAISLAGHTFAAWTSSDVTIAPNASSFVMPEGDVTVTATWTAKVDKYYDNMHDLTATDPDTGDPGTQDGAHYYITREGCKYHVPALSDNTSGATACHTTHYVLLGWIAQSYLESDGTVSEANKSHITTGGGEKTATGATYYAVWAIVE